jgi:amidohydrolase
MTRANVDSLKARVCEQIDRASAEIVAICDEVGRNPETGFREYKTSALVKDFFTRMDIPYRDHLALTGVKGRLGGGSSGPSIAIIGEMDALLVPGHILADPVTGAAHACGHNAQVASMIGAGIGLASVMDDLDGDVVLFAVPAEEGIEISWRLSLAAAGDIEFIVGKPELIRLGEFDDVDMAMLTHTMVDPEDGLASVGDSHNGALFKRWRFAGTAAHGGKPYRGVNALKAAELALHAIDAQRDTFQDEDIVRVNAIVTEGGDSVSIVPDDVRGEMIVRARSINALADANRKVDRSLRAGALATDASIEIVTIAGYLPHNPDPNLVSLIAANAGLVVGADHLGKPRHQPGCTDLGDVGCLMPVCHPRGGGVAGVNHGIDYRVIDPVVASVNPAKFMAMTVVDLLADGAVTAKRVMHEAGGKMSHEEYLRVRRGLGGEVQPNEVRN